MLRESKGNMYGFITHQWNPIRGRCRFDCKYCYMKRFGVSTRPPHLDEEYLKDDLGKGNFIFVGSGIDMWAPTVSKLGGVPAEWIRTVLLRCNTYEDNTYFFQTKNPARFYQFSFPPDHVFCATIETNRKYRGCKAPSVQDRVSAMAGLGSIGRRISITIEPIMDFDLLALVGMIENTNPEWVSIGTNTMPKVKLPEPSAIKVLALIEALLCFTKVVKKPNLERLMK